MQDIVITDIVHVLPNFIKWNYYLKIKKNIFSYPLKNTAGKKATLYQHGKWNSENGNVLPIFILHGLYGHPAVMLHLAEIAKKTHLGPVFSFYVSYDEMNLESHRSLIRQAMDYIEETVRDSGNSMKGIIMAGHSMGAIEAAYSAFVEGDKRILSVISIAGRLKLLEDDTRPCSESLKPTVKAISDGILSQPYNPLYQIVGKKDWIISVESTLIRNDADHYHVIEDAMHLDLLFHKNLPGKFIEYLHNSSYAKGVRHCNIDNLQCY